MKGRRESFGKGKERRKGKEKGKGKLEVKLWQKRKKSQTPQPGIEPGTPVLQSPLSQHTADQGDISVMVHLLTPEELTQTRHRRDLI